jgi:hypothetical protein
MRKFSFALIFVSFLSTSRAQIVKANWLIGGNVNFSRTKLTSDLGGYAETDVNAMGDIGYFFIDKLTAGIRPNLFFSKTKSTNSSGSTRSEIGPFLRYYFLSKEQRVNLFFDGSCTHGWTSVKNNGITTNKVSSNSFSIMGGPVVFLNSSVAVELSMGYSTTKFNDGVYSKRNIITSGLGLQFYLEKE